MDSGASRVIVPMVNTSQEARQAVEAVKYPPQGRRGLGLRVLKGIGRCLKRYCRWTAEESVVIVQIEHIQAVRNLDAICPLNISMDVLLGRMIYLPLFQGVPGQFDHPDMLDALNVIKESIQKKKSSPFGFHVVETGRGSGVF